MEHRIAFRPVRVVRASDGVVQQVKALIFGGKLAPGNQLPSEKDLAKQFGLSRVTIRDALRVLESQGLIEIRVGARGGAFVARPNSRPVTESLTNMLRLQRTTIRQLGEARLVVEPQVAALAAHRATARDVRAMAQAIANARAGLAARDPYFIPHSVAFHIALAEAAKNQVLLSAVSSFRTLFHEAVAQMLPANDMARRLMHTHLLYFAERVSKIRTLRRGSVP